MCITNMGKSSNGKGLLACFVLLHSTFNPEPGQFANDLGDL